MTPNGHRLRMPAAAAYIGLSASTLEKLRLYGGGPTYYKSGAKIVLYETSDLDAWLYARRRTSTSGAGSEALSTWEAR